MVRRYAPFREYFKSALHLSAIDYINKPLDIDELHETLGRVVSYVKEQRKKEAFVSALMQQQMANILIQDKIPPEEKLGLWKQSNPPEGDDIVIYTILVQHHYSESTSAFINEVAKSLGIWALIGQWNEFYIIHAAMKSEKSYLLNKFIDKLLNGSFIDEKSVVAVGKPVYHPLEIKESFHSAYAAFGRHFYYPDRRLFIGEGCTVPLDFGFDPIHEFKHLLIESPNQARQWLIQQFEYIRKHDGTPIELVQNWAFQMVSVLYLLNQNWENEVIIELNDGISLWKTITSLPTLDELKEFLLSHIDCFISQLNKNDNDSDLSVALEVKRYIHLHFANPLLTLENIAEHVKLSPTYLCELFKSTTGQTINQYLNNCRIRHAQLLLQTTHMKIQEVALACGYSGSNYFIKAFKKAVGITPLEYRKRNALI